MKEKLIKHLKINSNKYFFVLLLFIISMMTGILYVFFLKNENVDFLTEHIQSYLSGIRDASVIDKASAFKKAFFQCAVFYFTIFLFSFTNIGQYIPLCAIVLNGFSYGFTLAAFIEAFAYKGAVFSVLTLLPQLLIKSSAVSFMFICINSFNRNKKSKKEPETILAFVFLITISFVIYTLGLLYEYFFEIYFILNMSQTML